MKVGLDAYDRNARLKPALLLFLPATLTIMALAPDAILGWGGAIAAIIQAGGAFLLAQIIGDIGKRKEPKLFETFGGRPTERLLCHKHAPNTVTLAQRHAKLAKLMPGVIMPTAQDEQNDREAALDVYAACSEKLRGLTRDKEKYAAIFRENVHYGFRRNFWAVKSAGLAVAAVASIVVGVELYGYVSAHQPVSPLVPVILGINTIFAAVLLFLIKPAWVLRAANLYADRLLEALDTL